MTKEFESEIKESLFTEKILNIYKKFKFCILIVLIIIIIIPFFFQIKKNLNEKKYANQIYSYSLALNYFKQEKIKESINILMELSNSNNPSIVLISLNRLIDSNYISKSEKLRLIENVIKRKILSNEYTQLLKTKKSLLIFDDALESEMLLIYDNKHDSFFYKELSTGILNDFKTKGMQIENFKNNK